MMTASARKSIKLAKAGVDLAFGACPQDGKLNALSRRLLPELLEIVGSAVGLFGFH